MKILGVIVGALVLGTLLGAGWSVLEFRGADADLGAMVERLNAAQAPIPVHEPGNPIAVVVDGKEYDFGVMDLTETRTHTFLVRNEGDAPLTLELLGTTCKCAIGTLTEGAIAPGAVGKVELEWKAKDEAPEYRQSATIETNDPVNKVLYLSVSGKVTQIVRALPRSLIFTDIPASQGRSITFELLNFKEPNFNIVDHLWDDSELGGQFQFTYEPMTDRDLEDAYGAVAGYRCEVTVPPGLPMGSFQNLLTVKLDMENRAELQVPVRGNVVTDIRIVGRGYRDKANRLELGMVPKSGASSELMILAKGAHRDGLELSIDSITPEGVLSAEIGEGTSLNDGAVWKFPMKVLVLPSEKPISHLVASNQEPARIAIKTNHPTVGEIDVDVSFAIGGE